MSDVRWAAFFLLLAAVHFALPLAGATPALGAISACAGLYLLVRVDRHLAAERADED